VLSACGATDPEASLSIAPTRLTQIEQAREDCRLPASAVGDDGRTLIVDHKGEDDTDGISMDQLVCVLTALDVTDALVAQMGATRAMDGVQTGSWDGHTAVFMSMWQDVANAIFDHTPGKRHAVDEAEDAARAVFRVLAEPDDQTVERIARTISPILFDGPSDDQVGPRTQGARNDIRARVRAALKAVGDRT
jgi:hypothetical protein